MDIMPKSQKIIKIFKDREFIDVASCDLEGRPNVVPKFILKTESGFIYLVDYVMGRTWENLKHNPRVSMSIMDLETLFGYQINGSVEIIAEGKEYNRIMREFQEKEIAFSTKRIIEGVSRGKGHQSFEIGLPDNFIIFKVKVEEIVEIGPKGDLKREVV